jgi:hypothetical protein
MISSSSELHLLYHKIRKEGTRCTLLPFNTLEAEARVKPNIIDNLADCFWVIV